MTTIIELWDVFCLALWAYVCSAFVLWMFLFPLALVLGFIGVLWEQWQLHRWGQRKRHEAIAANEAELLKELEETTHIMEQHEEMCNEPDEAPAEEKGMVNDPPPA